MKVKFEKNKIPKGYSELALTAGILIGIFALFIPLPFFFLDFLLALNLALSVLLLILILQVKTPLEFSSFPGVVLVLTLFRLGLGLACTRGVLSQGYAGEVIHSFGAMLIKDGYLVGLAVLCILFLIQFLVITKGTNRSSEVIARFFLDSLPGKQMAIEGELNSGLISGEEAKRRRDEVSREGDFYGSMDGAVKFIRGDAILTFVLIFINLVGGVLIGIIQKGMDYETSFKTYSLLATGVGLALQIPALLISSASTLLVTGSSNKESLISDLIKAYVPQPRVLSLAMIFLLSMAFFSGFSLATILPLIGAGGFLGYFSLRKKSEKYSSGKIENKPVSDQINTGKGGTTLEKLKVDPLRIELGYGLIPLAQTTSSDNLFKTIPVLRRELISELGIRLPGVRVRDNLHLKPFEYSIILKEVELARGELFIDRLLAINPGDLPEIEGINTTEPAFGFPAKWIEQSRKKEAEDKGYNLVEPKAVLTTHLAELVKYNASELLGLQEVKDLLEELKESYPALIEEVYPQHLTLVNIQKILKNLLEESVPIKDLLTIFEVLAEKSPQIKDPPTLTQKVRVGLKRIITQQYIDSTGKITVFTLDPRIEQHFIPPEGLTDFKSILKPEMAQSIVHLCSQKFEELKKRGIKPIILLSSRSRVTFRQFIQESLPELAVLSYEEIVPKTEVYSIGTLFLEDKIYQKVEMENELKNGGKNR